MTRPQLALRPSDADATGVRIPEPLAVAQQALARALELSPGDAEAQLLALAHRLATQRSRETEPGISDNECDQRVAVSGETVDAMIAIPARTLTALRAKAQALIWCWGDEQGMRWAAEQPNLTTAERATYALVSDLLAASGDTVASSPDDSTEGGSLLAAAGDFLEARRSYEAAAARFWEAKNKADQLHPERPSITRCLPDGASPEHPAFKDPARRAAFERWTAQCAAIDSAYGVPPLEAVMEVALEAEDAASDKVVASEPRTISEAVAKYAVLLAAYLHPNGEEIAAAHPFVSFLNDLERLAKR